MQFSYSLQTNLDFWEKQFGDLENMLKAFDESLGYEAVCYFTNTRRNHRNPDPEETLRMGNVIKDTHNHTSTARTQAKAIIEKTREIEIFSFFAFPQTYILIDDLVPQRSHTYSLEDEVLSYANSEKYIYKVDCNRQDHEKNIQQLKDSIDERFLASDEGFTQFRDIDESNIVNDIKYLALNIANSMNNEAAGHQVWGLYNLRAEEHERALKNIFPDGFVNTIVRMFQDISYDIAIERFDNLHNRDTNSEANYKKILNAVTKN